MSHPPESGDDEDLRHDAHWRIPPPPRLLAPPRDRPPPPTPRTSIPMQSVPHMRDLEHRRPPLFPSSFLSLLRGWAWALPPSSPRASAFSIPASRVLLQTPSRSWKPHPQAPTRASPAGRPAAAATPAVQHERGTAPREVGDRLRVRVLFRFVLLPVGGRVRLRACLRRPRLRCSRSRLRRRLPQPRPQLLHKMPPNVRSYTLSEILNTSIPSDSASRCAASAAAGSLPPPSCCSPPARTHRTRFRCSRIGDSQEWCGYNCGEKWWA
ncbi:hypothetical protein B0H11DRAFT_2005210 [Mycena galericulata]|nr:hypothetical protein B0H11DRAFT_2005210 [Mycena galericulata]